MTLFLIDLIGRTVLELFSGVCDFGQEVGVNHYQDVYSFEGGLSDEWSSWSGGLPRVSEDEAFCGRHSLYVCLILLLVCINYYTAGNYELQSLVLVQQFGPKINTNSS